MSISKKLTQLALATAGTAAYLYAQNTWIQTSEYNLAIPFLAPENNGLRIVHLSDLHLPLTKIDLNKLVEKVAEAKPDVIFLTGDQVDAEVPFDPEEATLLMSYFRHIAPVFVVNGNHDISSPNRQKLAKVYSDSNCTLLENEAYSVQLAGRAPLVVMGIAEGSRMQRRTKKNKLQPIAFRPEWANQTKLLLAHHPEDFPQFFADPVKAPNVTFSGHAHGGQIRIPGIGGLFAPGQGRLPKHTSGVYAYEGDKSKQLVVSRGLGPSRFPFRVNNRPEMIVTTLRQPSFFQ